MRFYESVSTKPLSIPLSIRPFKIFFKNSRLAEIFTAQGATPVPLTQVANEKIFNLKSFNYFLEHLCVVELIYTLKNFTTERSLFVCCTEDIYKKVLQSSLFVVRVRSHAPSIQYHRGTKVVWPDFQPMRVPEEPVFIDLFRQNSVFTSLHLKSPVHVHRLS